jgi:RNA ligase
VTDLSDLLDVDLLSRHVVNGYVREAHHPTEPLRIYNYTAKTQWSRTWDGVTTQCRGLMVGADDQVVARPFAKFFNLSDYQTDDPTVGPIELEPPIEVYEKVDGSLGIAYRQPSDGRLAWATRGSFVSDQAVWATAFWHAQEREFAFDLDRVTVLAEIVYPDNRIVVDYAGAAYLALLAVLDIATGEQVLPSAARADVPTTWAGGPVVGSLGQLVDLDISSLPVLDNAEGFVLLSADRRTRVKCKLPEYVRLHALLTGVTERHIWDRLSQGESLAPLRELVPDEFLAWVDRVEAKLRAERDALEFECRTAFQAVLDETRRTTATADEREYRKAFALLAVKQRHASALFTMLDGRSEKLNAYLWLCVKPEADLPFTLDADVETAPEP